MFSRRIPTAGVAVLLVMSAACIKQKSPIASSNPMTPVLRALTVAEKQLVRSSNKFGLKLFKQIAQEETDNNIFISPLSVEMALAMAYNGAEGSTRDAMRATLELENLSDDAVNESYQSLIELLSQLDPKVVFRIGNSVWYREGLPVEQSFISLLREYFSAAVKGLDFSDPNASKTINAWVGESTNGRIKEIVEPVIDPLTMMYLINAIYFKGIWTSQFDPRLTRDDWFTLPDGSRKPCKMMTREGELRYFSSGDLEAIDLPYGDAGFSMTVLLPARETSVNALIEQLSGEKWSNCLASLSERRGTLFLPKFKLEYEKKLNEVLTVLGMGIAFRPGMADLSRMCKDAELFITNVKHKTFVEVNEEGTEAAAATSVEVGVTSVGLVVRVDRPFLFAIRDSHSQTVLFMGRIVEPTW